VETKISLRVTDNISVYAGKTTAIRHSHRTAHEKIDHLSLVAGSVQYAELSSGHTVSSRANLLTDLYKGSYKLDCQVTLL